MESISFVYSLPYICLLFAYLLLMLCENRIGRGYSRIMCGFLFVFFFGGRGFIGWDWTAYYDIYESFPSVIDSSFINELLFRESENKGVMEKGFLVYLALMKSFGFNYFMFVFFSVFIDVLLVDRFIQRFCPNYALAMLLFVYVYCNAEINLQRNMKSIVLFLYSLQYVEQKKIIPFMALNLLGLTFHFSAIFYILSYWLFRIPIGRSVYIILVLLLNAVYFFKINLLGDLITLVAGWVGGKAEVVAEIYTNSSITREAGVSIGSIERLITSLLVFVFWTDLKEHVERGKIFINSFIVYLIWINLFWPFSIFIERLSLLYMFCYIYIWSIIIKSVSLKKVRYMTLGCLFLYSTLRFGLKYNTVFYRYDNFLLLNYEEEEQRRGTFNRYKNLFYK